MVKPVIVIMAGGRGERFWPKSRAKKPKQLLNLVGSRSLLQQSVERISPLTDPDRILVVVNKEYAEAVRSELPQLPAINILAEPVGRNTAPCVGLAATYAAKRFPDEDLSIAILPSDPLVFNPEEMRRVLQAGFAFSADHHEGVIYGMWPSRPETGYGYIQIGRELGNHLEVPYFQVQSFTEKPDRTTAESYLASRDYLWNGGIFLWKLSSLMNEINTLLPELAAGLAELQPDLDTEQAESRLADIYPNLPAISFDYGVLEKTKKLIVIPTDFGWDDLGSWTALGRVLPRDEYGNVAQGEHVGVATENCIIYSPKKSVATLGVSDLIIVECEDVLMVCANDKAQEIKKLLEELRRRNREELL